MNHIRLISVIIASFSLACSSSSKEPTVVPQTEAPEASSTPQWLTDAISTGAATNDEPCELDNPTYRALAHLNVGMTSDPERARIAVDTHPDLQVLWTAEVGQKWRTSWAADLATDDGIRAMMASHPTWTNLSLSMPRRLSLSPPNVATTGPIGEPDDETGTWTLNDGTIEVVFPSQTTTLTPSRLPYALFLEGQDGSWFTDPVMCY